MTAEHPRNTSQKAQVTSVRSLPQREAVLTLEQAAFGYAGVASVRGITAHIFPGESVALVGPNGSGKSTLLGGILGLTEHLAGSLRVFGGTPQAARARVGSLPQADRRNTELPITLQQAVTMGLYRELGVFGRVGTHGKKRVQEALARVGLAGAGGQLFGSLSGGQQQRGILARALVSQPDLVLLDEPFNGLDQPNREALLLTVNELRASGVTVIVSTHDLELAQQACSHVMLLNGSMVGYGTVAETLTPELITETFAGAAAEEHHHSGLPHSAALAGAQAALPCATDPEEDAPQQLQHGHEHEQRGA